LVGCRDRERETTSGGQADEIEGGKNKLKRAETQKHPSESESGEKGESTEAVARASLIRKIGSFHRKEEGEKITFVMVKNKRKEASYSNEEKKKKKKKNYYKKQRGRVPFQQGRIKNGAIKGGRDRWGNVRRKGTTDVVVFGGGGWGCFGGGWVFVSFCPWRAQNLLLLLSPLRRNKTSGQGGGRCNVMEK